MLILEKTSIYFTLREISFVIYVHALILRMLMTQKLCTVGMCNAILRNHLKLQQSVYFKTI